MAGWKKHSENKGSPAKGNRHWETGRRHLCASVERTEGKSEVITVRNISVCQKSIFLQAKRSFIKEKAQECPKQLLPLDTPNSRFE